MPPHTRPPVITNTTSATAPAFRRSVVPSYRHTEGHARNVHIRSLPEQEPAARALPLPTDAKLGPELLDARLELAPGLPRRVGFTQFLNVHRFEDRLRRPGLKTQRHRIRPRTRRRRLVPLPLE